MTIYLKQMKSSFAEGERPYIAVRFEAVSLKALVEELGKYATETSWELATEEEWAEQLKESDIVE